jgi:hypothetical protein
MHRAFRFPLALLLAFLPAVAALAQEDEKESADRTYEVFYDVRIVPTESAARVAITIGDGSEWLDLVDFRIDPERHFDFRGDGEVVVADGRVKWTPPRTGGTLRYTFLIDHLRDDRSYDARCTRTWALFRGDDLIPPARTRFEAGARSFSRLRLRVPEGWSRAVPYPLRTGGIYRVSHADRLFDRPTGWFVVGHLGAVREEVADVEVAIAGPVQHGQRRFDMLALLRWTLPTLEEVLGKLPPRLLIVGAGDPMWRGGLSGPRSVYVHNRRPLIEGDGTSPLLHEILHSILAIHAGRGGDWIVEGLAEYYSLEALRRSGTVSDERIQRNYAKLEKEGRAADELESNHTTGDAMARAVTALRSLDREIRKGSDGEHSLDDVARALVGSRRKKVTTDRLKQLVIESTGLDLSAFIDRLVAIP